MFERTQKKNYFQNELPNEVMIYVFKYVKNPMNLTVSCKRWSFICKDSQAKAEWIIYQFGKAQCLFHAVRLGPKFISVDVARAIITKGGILSRYFVQRLLIHYGNYDQKLIELKIVHSVGQTDIDSIKALQQKTIPWASNLPISVYIFLLTEASYQFNTYLYLKGNDMELFHFLTGALLILFPPSQPPGWTKPDIKTVKARLTELIDLGFQLNYSIILDIFHLFESRLDVIGKILIDSFADIKQETHDLFLRRCLDESQNPVKNFTNITSFLNNYLSNTAVKKFDNSFNPYSKNLKNHNFES
ncbi:5737_t:CDS:2 [Cetraspora pellucida]|uniref:5737_t:CDS:1 n=1 Tax=Cetraspora pellucida TaxID=1433469 RepID=A0ACA9KCU9_9GLOM|nr:5737_t:CDS:2 [Cetraspora pellucida]